MAHATEIADDWRRLVSRLIEDNGHSVSGPALEHQCRTALRDVRATHYPRTNQFDVETRLDGLEEKFFVLNNDALAEALERTRTELHAISYHYSPEILSLLLLLADRPAEKTRLEDLSDGAPPVRELSTLTWQDILADDPLGDEDVWDYIEHGSHSSGYASHDEATSPKYTMVKDDTLLDVDLNRRLILGHSKSKAVNDLYLLRHNVAIISSGSANTSELQLVRRVLSSLQGLPSASDDSGAPLPTSGHFGPETIRAILFTVHEQSEKINWLRTWARQLSGDVLLQRMRHATLQWLLDFDRHLSQLEQRCTNGELDAVITLQSVMSEMTTISQLLVRLSALVQSSDSASRPWALLDALYHECCLLDISGQDKLLNSFTALFHACLLVYLKLFRTWMSSGSPSVGTEGDFFVLKTSEGQSGHLSTLWHRHFEISRSEDTINIAPFLLGRLERIFICGKSAAFLSALGLDPEQTPEASLYFTEEELVHLEGESCLSSFADRFEQCLQSWLQDSFDLSAGRLKHALITHHHLVESMAAFGGILLGGDGAGMDDFCQAIYVYMDAGDTVTSIGGSTLTAIAQSVFDTHLHRAHLDRSLLISISDKQGQSRGLMKALSGLDIKLMLPWPLQNITLEREPTNCQQAFTILLGLHRARHLLALLSVRAFTAAHRQQITQLLKLRHRLRWFADIIYTSFCEAGSSYTVKVVSDIKAAQDIEGMVAAYKRFSTNVQKAFFLEGKSCIVMEKLTSMVDMVNHVYGLWPATIADIGGSAVAGSSHELDKMILKFDTTLSTLCSTLRSFGHEEAGPPTLLAQLETFRG